eukprot:scaffold54498_cov31-Tisochrysis_lutea.AAC.1
MAMSKSSCGRSIVGRWLEGVTGRRVVSQGGSGCAEWTVTNWEHQLATLAWAIPPECMCLGGGSRRARHRCEPTHLNEQCRNQHTRFHLSPCAGAATSTGAVGVAHLLFSPPDGELGLLIRFFCVGDVGAVAG